MKRNRLEIFAIAFILLTLLFVAGFAPANGQVEPEENKVEYWCEDGIKYEPVDTPFIVPAPPAGTTWTLIVLKAGTTNETESYPVSGQEFSHSLHDNSHVILCWEETPPETTTSSTTSSTTTSSTTTTTLTDTTTTVPDTTTSSSTTTPRATTTSTDPTESTTSTSLESTTTSTGASSTTGVPTTTLAPTSTVTTSTLPVTGVPDKVLPLALVFLAVGTTLLSLSWLLGVRRSGG